jgi:hypothetical protein
MVIPDWSRLRGCHVLCFVGKIHRQNGRPGERAAVATKMSFGNDRPKFRYEEQSNMEQEGLSGGSYYMIPGIRSHLRKDLMFLCQLDTISGKDSFHKTNK